MPKPKDAAPQKASVGSDDGARDDVIRHVKFNYIKSAFYRVVHVDGVIGGLTPRGLIHGSLFSEGPVIPRIVRHEVREDGSLSDGEVVEAREGISREMEVDIVFDETVAENCMTGLDVR